MATSMITAVNKLYRIYLVTDIVVFYYSFSSPPNASLSAGYDQFAKDIKLMMDSAPNLFWRITWCFLSPTVLVALLIFYFVMFSGPSYGEYQYPGWAIAFTWIIAFFTIGFIPVIFLYRYCSEGGWIVSISQIIELLVCLLFSLSPY